MKQHTQEPIFVAAISGLVRQLGESKSVAIVGCSSRLLPVAAIALLIACGAPKNAAIGTWEGMSGDPGFPKTRTRLTIDEKNATLYDKTGAAVGSFPVAFPRPNEAVISGTFGIAVDVTVQPDGSARVVGLGNSYSMAKGTERSSDVFHRVNP